VRRAYEQPGRILRAAQLHELARAWYGDRLDPGWTPRDRAASQAVLESVGLTGSFWRLAS
jgi:hypothetical protein